MLRAASAGLPPPTALSPRGYRDGADPIFPEYSLIHRRRAAEEMYGDPHEVIAAVLETESAA